MRHSPLPLCNFVLQPRNHALVWVRRDLLLFCRVRLRLHLPQPFFFLLYRQFLVD